MNSRQHYVPALGFDALTRFYDPLIRWFLRERTFKEALLEQARIADGHRVLDVGCGTGTLTLMVKRATPAAEVIGIDGDPKILAIARRKTGDAVRFDEGLASALPYADGSFDRVITSLVLHHLTTGEKQRALEEILRVLKPGGELHVADWVKPVGAFARLASRGVQLVDGAETTRDNFEGRLPGMIAAVGFIDVQETRAFLTVGGTLGLIRARKH